MHKTVVLELKGNLEQQGFYVTLHIAQEGKAFSATEDGYLPSSLTLLNSLTQWQQDYRRLASPTRALKPYKLKVDGNIHPLEACLESAQQLAQQFDTWLKAESFREIELRLRQLLMPNDSIRVLIRTTDAHIQSLPWHLWDFIKQYSQAEIILSGLRSHTSTQELAPRLKPPQVKILAVLGDRQNIDIERDRHLLNQLPDATVEFLVEPTHQMLHDYLYEQSWDILFFAGHSETESNGQGIIRLNSNTHLTISEVSYAVQRAIANGLQLAIFNSCDGLGLARDLADLQLPHLIVMREAVPDAIAQQFLKYLLRAFAQGYPLHLAERQARERLQGLETQFPCASWLPVIYQHPATYSLTWQGLQGSQANSQFSRAELKDSETHRRMSNRTSAKAVGLMIAISLLSSLLIMGMRWVGLLQSWELRHYDQLFQGRSPELPDSRILLVGMTEADVRTYHHPLPDDVLANLIEKLEQSQPYAIGLDIYRDQPVPSNPGTLGYRALISKFQTNSNLVTPCTFGSETVEAIAPPPESPSAQVGFVDLDTDASSSVVRRHLLSHKLSSPSLCNTDYSFVLQLLFRYIDQSDGRFSIEITPELDWQIYDAERDRQTVFRRLSSRSGGYQNLDARGNQILVNYRTAPTIARQVSVQDILDGRVDASWVRNRIVLIGVVAPSIQDYHDTPVGRLRGLQVHAQSLSYILSAIEDDRPLITWMPQWADFLFVFTWTAIGGIMGLSIYTSTKLRTKLLQGSLLFGCFGTCMILVHVSGHLALSQHGLWLPIIPTGLALATSGCIALLNDW